MNQTQLFSEDYAAELSKSMRLLATAALAAGCLLAPATLQAQSSSAADPYQGVSHPPADDTIQATPDAAPAPYKPSPGVPAARAPYASPGSSPATNLDAGTDATNDPKSADYGIVTSVPAPGSDEKAPAGGSYAPTRNAHLIARPPENPDFGIVEMVASPSNQLAEGTDIRVRLLETLSTSTTQDGSPFRGQVAADVYKEGRVVIPVGSELRGRVMSVTQGHRMGAPATLRLRPDAVLLPDGTSYHLYAQAVRSDAPDTRTDAEGGIQPSSRVERNLIELGAGSGGGAATGAVFGGPVGAGVGALVGVGVVTAHLLLQHPHQAQVEQGSEVTFSLTEPMDLLPTRN